MANIPNVPVSVIVPAYNRASLIQRCLESITNQTLLPAELIVVDNASTDNTVEVVKNWMDKNKDRGVALKLLTEEKQGACNARHKGLENAAGEYVFFFDSDDEMLPNLFERVFRDFDDSLDMVCWKAEILQLDGSKRIPAIIKSHPLESHLIHSLLRPQGYLIRKEVLKAMGGWSKPIPVWNDLELGLRILLANPKLKIIPEILVRIYSQEESITGKDFSSKEGQWEQTIREMEKVISSLSHKKRKKIQRILDYRKAILAAQYYREGNRSGAECLMSNVLKSQGITDRLLLRFSYLFTRSGLRGVWRIVRFAY